MRCKWLVAGIGLVCAGGVIVTGVLPALTISPTPSATAGNSPSTPAEAQRSGIERSVLRGRAEATWVRPYDVADLAQRATGVVAAEVTDISVGAAIDPPDVSVHPTPAIPTQRIRFRVDAVLRGDAPKTFTLFRTGSRDFEIEGDPPYAVGERYVMFIEPQRASTGGGITGLYLPVGPDGRLKLEGDGRLRTFIKGGPAAALSGKTRQSLLVAVEAAAARGSREDVAPDPPSPIRGSRPAPR